MIHYHGGPVTPTGAAVALWTRRHAFVSFQRPDQMALAAEVCQSFALDNGAYTLWKRGGGRVDVSAFGDWVAQWVSHPGFDFAIIPDVIDGTDFDNERMIASWYQTGLFKYGVPVWHLHESLERLRYLSIAYPRVALGSSGRWADPGSEAWWERMDEAMPVVCDDEGRPRCKLHGLRMLSPTIFSHLPLASADSCNVALNIGIDKKWGGRIRQLQNCSEPSCSRSASRCTPPPPGGHGGAGFKCRSISSGEPHRDHASRSHGTERRRYASIARSASSPSGGHGAAAHGTTAARGGSGGGTSRQSAEGTTIGAGVTGRSHTGQGAGGLALQESAKASAHHSGGRFIVDRFLEPGDLERLATRRGLLARQLHPRGLQGERGAVQGALGLVALGGAVALALQRALDLGACGGDLRITPLVHIAQASGEVAPHGHDAPAQDDGGDHGDAANAEPDRGGPGWHQAAASSAAGVTLSLAAAACVFFTAPRTTV